MTVPAIKQRRAASNQALAEGDILSFGSILSEDVTVAFSAGLALQGRAAVIAAISAQKDQEPSTVYVRTPKAIKISRDGGAAHEDGHWSGRWPGEHGLIEGGGRYSAAWRQDNGLWLIAAEIFVQI